MKDLSENDILEIANEVKQSEYYKRQMKINKEIDDLSSSQIQQWFDLKIKDSSKHNGIIVLFDKSEQKYASFTDEAYTLALLNRLQKVFNHNNWSMSHNIVKDVTDNTYTFVDALYAFYYKNNPYIIQQVSGQGTHFVTLTNFNVYKMNPTKIDDEVWDYSEIGNWLRIDDNFNILPQ